MHVSIFGEKCGLTPEQVEDVTVSKTWRDLKPGLWNKREQLVVRMVDELHHHSTIADETWLQLTEHFPNDQVVELIFSSSFYHMAAFYLNSTAVPLEDGSQRFPEGVMQRSEEHTSELQSLMRISYAVICLKKKIKIKH